MDVNLAHWHLLLNHFPIIGSIIGLTKVCSWHPSLGEHQDLRRASFIIFTGIAFLSIGTFLTGFGAQAMVTGKPGISDALIQRHEGSAMLTIWFIEITGALSAVALWQYHRLKRPAEWTVAAVLLFCDSHRRSSRQNRQYRWRDHPSLGSPQPGLRDSDRRPHRRIPEPL